MNPELPTLESLREREALSDLDLHFANAMCRLAKVDDDRVRLAAALVSRQVQRGHVCLELARICSGTLRLTAGDGTPIGELPADYEAWRAALLSCALVGDDSSNAPLHLDPSGRLYLRRYFELERALGLRLLERSRRPDLVLREPLLRQGLDRFFGTLQTRRRARAPSPQLALFATDDEPDAAPNLQRVAAERALRRPLCVISCGPGTGKTSTVAKILALLCEQSLAETPSRKPRCLLLAPTGKAAARLHESIARAKAELRCSDEVRAAIAEEASTIHRALGLQPDGARRFRRDRESRLAADVVVVDEASMVDLALMARLLDAIPDDARVILLGDRNQLASVEAGAVLGDICGAGLPDAAAGAEIAKGIVVLERSYRYDDRSGIRALADAINAGDAERALAILRDPTMPDVELCESKSGDPPPSALLRAAVQKLTPFFAAESADAKLERLAAFRVLCAHRRGAHGQVAINAAIEARLREEGVVSSHGDRYAGRPILITQNDHQARLFNGDVGVLAQDENDPERIVAVFAGERGELRRFAIARLPPYESVYAMSVHKSQGSEFDEVAVLLPSEPSPVLSRELLYTAVTRARSRVVVYAPADVLALAVRTAVDRASGLRAVLYGR